MVFTPEPSTRCKTWSWAGSVKEMIVFTLMEKNILLFGEPVRKIILVMPGAASLLISIAMIYTVASGLYGVVWTDVFQGAFIFSAIMYMAYTIMFTDKPQE